MKGSCRGVVLGRWYDPTVESEIPDRYRGCDGLTNPVEFADEYGLLGYAQLHNWEGIPTPEMGDPPQMGIRP